MRREAVPRWSGYCATAPDHPLSWSACAKQRSEPSSDKRGAKVAELTLTPLKLIERIAAPVPPPRTHRHRYSEVLAPNSPLRSAVTALAQAAPVPLATAQTEPAITSEDALGVVPTQPGHAALLSTPYVLSC